MSFAKGKLIKSLISKEPPEDKSGWTINSQKEGDVLSTWGLTNICLELILWTFKSFHTCSERPKWSKCGSRGWRKAAQSPSTAVWVLLVSVPATGWLWWFINVKDNTVPFLEVFAFRKIRFQVICCERGGFETGQSWSRGARGGWWPWPCPEHGATGTGHGRPRAAKVLWCLFVACRKSPGKVVCNSAKLSVGSCHFQTQLRYFKGSSFEDSGFGPPTRLSCFMIMFV